MVKIDDKNVLIVMQEHKLDHEQTLKMGTANSNTFPSLEDTKILVDVLRKAINNQQINLIGAGFLYAYSYTFLAMLGFPKPKMKKTDGGFYMMVGSKNEADVDISLINEHYIIITFLNQHFKPMFMDDGSFIGITTKAKG